LIIIITLVALKRFVFNGLGSGLASLLNIVSDAAKTVMKIEAARIEANLKTANALENLAIQVKNVLALLREDRQLMQEHHKTTEEMYSHIAKRKSDFFHLDTNTANQKT
jgi:hypothetical protein